MCHYCGADIKLKDEKGKLENGVSFELISESPTWSCRLCQEKMERQHPNRDALSSASPTISPTTSFSSSDRSVSSCSDFSVDLNPYDRYNHEHGGVGISGQLHNPSINMSGNNRTESNLKENFGDQQSDRDIVRDVDIIETSSSQEAKDGRSEVNSGDDEMDAQIWEPPEAEDPEDDFEGSVAFNDDDDEECGDGTQWGKPSSLSSEKDDASESYKFKEEKQKAIEEVLNGKFKTVVSQLLKTAGVTSEKDSECWVDVITSLSWEAASFLKPDAIIDGKAMGPDAYVKVKCIATGSRSESQVIRGLVFKKHAAHKHMPTKYKSPRLLLIRGVLGESSSGLSSFKSMDQEKDSLKSLMEMIEMCHPNVVLVEKSVSRDIQESILGKGMTLVYDMKLHRLERVARCTGSPILSADGLMNQKLKQCDSFHIEKFVEEHAGSVEGGKKPSKTLMFIEGCPTRLGCTILLKGSNSDELKRVKYVVQIAVVMAYRLILETSFLVDQKAMFSSILLSGVVDVARKDQQSSDLEASNHIASLTSEAEPSAVDIPIINGFHEEAPHNLNLELEGDSALSYVPYNPVIFSGLSTLSTSLKKVIGSNFPLASSAPYRSLSTYFGFNGRGGIGQTTEEVPVLKTLEAFDPCDVKTEGGSDEENLIDDEHSKSLKMSLQPPLEKKVIANNEDQSNSKDGVNSLLDNQSILVLMSSRNTLRGTICEQSHFSHIMFYKNFDVPLGKFLRDNLLNQNRQCTVCGELPEAHFYYYAHHKKQLTIRVRHLMKRLPGEAEGKLWMWSRCGKCKHESGVLRSTKRVLISNAARSLSFGKFLELSFSHHSSSRVSSCGHSLEGDFVYFFGLGPMAAMFKYSPVTTFTVCLPPLKLEFSHGVKVDMLKKEFQHVYMKGMLLFNGIAEALKKLRPQFSGLSLKLGGFLKEFSVVEEMLKQEFSDFEAKIHNAVVISGDTSNTVHKFLSMNRLLWELLLESYIWERRLHSLHSRDVLMISTDAPENRLQSKMDGTINGKNEGSEIDTGDNDKAFNNLPGRIYTSAEANILLSADVDISVDGSMHNSMEENNPLIASSLPEDVHRPEEDVTSNNQSLSPDTQDQNHSVHGSFKLDNFASDDLQSERTIPITGDTEKTSSATELDLFKKGTSPQSLVLSLEKSSGWFWKPFSEIQQIYLKDLQKGFVPKYQSVSSYVQDNIPAAYQLISEEGRRLHIPLGSGNYFVRDYDGELSSIISCALAFMKDLPVSSEVLDGDEKKVGMSAKLTDGLHVLARFPTMTSAQWPSLGSESDSVHSAVSIASEESRFSSFDGLNLLESLVASENISPEISMGFVKSLGKGRYSVICLYANQFRELRSRCCPSEFDYIASLSRCKNWDAKGGKSKSFFAKTQDDRFIIKEIKKTEFDSFLKFAPNYFKHMIESFEVGNQTCLAKVLGIYQVIVRQAKSGKEMRHDLMVMENLTFGRNITRQYDLKGALHARFNSAADGSGDVLLDQNFVNDMNNSPLYVSHKAKRLLERAVWNDTTFLNTINVMDYSLLVGVDTQRRELVCGIIDYLRQYTWDKQFETWVKISLVVPKNELPTVISPIEYKKRFRKFMATHFLSVPDSWCSQNSSRSDRCDLCGIRGDGSSQLSSGKQGEENEISY